MNEIVINFEGREKDCAFFALYAGLRAYYENKKNIGSHHKDAISIAGAEAYSMLDDLKTDFPKEYEEAKKEYDQVYGNVIFHQI